MCGMCVAVLREEPCPELQELARHYFEGWLQSRANEKLNRLMKDSMTRGSPSKVSALVVLCARVVG